MNSLIGIFTLAVFIAAMFLYPRWPRCTVLVAVLCVLAGLLAIAIILFAPVDYMMRLPPSFADYVHPYRLALSFPLILFGIAGLMGIGIKFVIMRVTRNNTEQNHTANSLNPRG